MNYPEWQEKEQALGLESQLAAKERARIQAEQGPVVAIGGSGGAGGVYVGGQQSDLDRSRATAQALGLKGRDLGSLGIHGLLENRIRQLEDEVVQLRALRNWLPQEVPQLVEEALWRRFQWSPR